MSINSNNNHSMLSSPKNPSKSGSEKENIQVYLRLRPQNETERTNDD